jgi:hypothetical protein
MIQRQHPLPGNAGFLDFKGLSFGFITLEMDIYNVAVAEAPVNNGATHLPNQQDAQTAHPPIFDIQGDVRRGPLQRVEWPALIFQANKKLLNRNPPASQGDLSVLIFFIGGMSGCWKCWPKKGCYNKTRFHYFIISMNSENKFGYNAPVLFFLFYFVKNLITQNIRKFSMLEADTGGASCPSINSLAGFIMTLNEKVDTVDHRKCSCSSVQRKANREIR